MKKIFGAIVLLSLFGSFGTALAAGNYPDGFLPADQCHVPPDHGVYNADNSALVGCITQTAWDNAAAKQASNNARHLPIVSAGTTVYDEKGLDYPCFWYMSQGCYDLTHTDAYRAEMRAVAHSGPRFAPWLR